MVPTGGAAIGAGIAVVALGTVTGYAYRHRGAMPGGPRFPRTVGVLGAGAVAHLLALLARSALAGQPAVRGTGAVGPVELFDAIGATGELSFAAYPVLWAVVALQYAGHGDRISPGLLGAIGVGPLLWFLEGYPAIGRASGMLSALLRLRVGTAATVVLLLGASALVLSRTSADRRPRGVGVALAAAGLTPVLALLTGPAYSAFVTYFGVTLTLGTAALLARGRAGGSPGVAARYVQPDTAGWLAIGAGGAVAVGSLLVAAWSVRLLPVGSSGLGAALAAAVVLVVFALAAVGVVVGVAAAATGRAALRNRRARRPLLVAGGCLGLLAIGATVPLGLFAAEAGDPLALAAVVEAGGIFLGDAAYRYGRLVET